VDSNAFIPEINPLRCIGCELCVRLCPNHVLDMVDDLPVIANPEACTYSALCEENCPTQAISLPFEIVF
jgi:NAD-dependent dihydropyrimidine dehydrogenase PreA subunit